MTGATRTLRSPQKLALPCKEQVDTLTARHLAPTCSSPAPSTCSTPSTRGKTRLWRASLSLSSADMSTTSSARGGDDSDGSEDEHDVCRLGGCSQGPLTGPHDDSNKENIAPLRHASLHALEQEQTARQEESVAQRTRARAAVPMSDRSPAPMRRMSQSSTNTSSTARMFRRTVSTPSTRKRLRGALDVAELEQRAASGDVDVRTPTTPLSRVRLEYGCQSARSVNDDAESYFSSQAASVFDSLSAHESFASLSRCTSPDEDDCVEKARSDGNDDSFVNARPTQQTFANIYVHAKALLRYGTGTDAQVVGRHRERSSLQRFLQKRFNLFAHLEHSASPEGEVLDLDGASESASLYICGLPGTGKTALVRSILTDLEQGDKRPRIAFVDCMSVQHPREIFAKILEALGERGGGNDVEAEKLVGTLVKDPCQRTLIVLDEIDHLLRNRAHQNILYRLFSWGAAAPSTATGAGAFALIGIANSLDLTERFVPLLASKGAAPAVLNFRPFDAAEITTVVRARLSQLHPCYDAESKAACEASLEQEGAVPLMEPAALELAAKKVATATGDLRKALDACRLAVDAVEADETQRQDPSLFCRLTPTTAAKVKPAHILRVLSTVLGSPQLTKIRALGLQSKLVLLGLLVAQKRQAAKLDVLGGTGSMVTGGGASTGEMRIGTVEHTYAAMLKNDDAGAFSTVESSELMDVVEGLEVEGVVRIISEAAFSVSSSKVRSSACTTASVSPSGKRAAKKQLLASNRAVALTMAADDVLRGICTPAPLSAGQETSKVVVEAMNRMWTRECDRIERSQGWETMAQHSQSVLDEELGGGRGAVGF